MPVILTRFGVCNTMCILTAEFTEEPVSVTMAEGLDAVFECQYQSEEDLVPSYNWAIDSTVLEVSTDTVRFLAPLNDEPATLTILATAQHNNSVIQCVVVVFRDDFTIVRTAVSGTATLTVQGELHTYTCSLAYRQNPKHETLFVNRRNVDLQIMKLDSRFVFSVADPSVRLLLINIHAV